MTEQAVLPWWKEPTKDQWLAWSAGTFGWTLDGFDFTIFIFVMVAIAKEFGVSVTALAGVLTVTLWLRLFGAIAAGWLADRIGRKIPLMIAILWFSLCNFIAGFSPNFTFLFIVRAALGIGMGAEWPAGASLAMESWPARSRGLMGCVMQGGFPIGFALASAAYGLLFDSIGWRGLFWAAALPSVLCLYLLWFVKEPPVWLENRRRQREAGIRVNAPPLVLFKPGLLMNTLTACWWMAGVATVYYSVFGLFASWLQTEFRISAALIATPVLLANLVSFAACWIWGDLADRIGRRGTCVIVTVIGCIVAPCYLLTRDVTWIIGGFIVQGFFAGTIVTLAPAYLTERFPTSVRSTAAGFCYHVGIVFGAFVPVGASYLAIEGHMGFAMPLLIATWFGSANLLAALVFGPETRGKVFVPDLMEEAAPLVRLAEAAAPG
jgi:MFS transporter, SHS family, lactate transporter